MWKRGELAEVYDRWADTESVFCLPRNEGDDSGEIPKCTPVLIIDPYSEEGFEKYGDHGGEKWMLVLWEKKEWFVYASDLRRIEKARKQ